jgi:hypothetical protein
MTFKNQPYVKKYDSMGNVTNPIQRAYINFYPNRSFRRSFGKPQDYRDYLQSKKDNLLKKQLSVLQAMRGSNKAYVRKLNNELKSLYGIFKQALEKSSANKQWI